MQIGVIVATTVVFWILAVVMSLRIANLVQLEGYRVVNSRKMRSIKCKLIGSAVCITLCNGIFSFIAVSIGSFYVQLVVQGLYVIVLLVSLTDERDKCLHQPLIYTARAKRLLVTYSIITLLLLAVVVIVGSVIKIKGVGLSFVLVPLIFALLPAIMRFAIYANKPLEKSIASKFIEKCTDELNKRRDLMKIGITGSFGKTTVKNILTTILNQKYKAYCTPSNFNTPLGICRAVNDLPDECEVFIAEMGARRVGDISELCDIVKPTYGMITGVGSQHLGTFKSVENIYSTKKELSDYVEKVGGAVVYSGENELSLKMYEESNSLNRIAISVDRFLSSKNNAENISISEIECDSKGLRFLLSIGDKSVRCNSALIGKHNLNNILLCVAMARELGLNIVQIADGIGNVTPIEHRLQTIELPTGITIIDDSYNSNEEGAKLALEALKLFKGRKIVATQGLVEMGAKQEKVNFELGESIANVADIAILIGINRENIRLGMLAESFCDKNIYLVEHLDNAKDLFSAMLVRGDVLLLQNDLPDNY
ncbi:MAG: UDP-N-acetylmuramoyl-tripeptide--D-alanyl-D-alanine ligase [Clostridia bacterium]|nr:UDP-N-acetylmuramoyl-tripeptide--D-alanyl-D-alanine ligase [Clostridia bacterium]MDE7328398.1 UDP-N-acetylmuramoyl-tripeptide--D-alanyl-D-alanine ligase [Clostridia bacterium]